jgi:hypothetical protein
VVDHGYSYRLRCCFGFHNDPGNPVVVAQIESSGSLIAGNDAGARN